MRMNEIPNKYWDIRCLFGHAYFQNVCTRCGKKR